MKQCSKCKIPKEYSEFTKNKVSKDGHHYVCKKCIKEYSDIPEVKEKHNLYTKNWRKINSDYNKEWYKLNKEIHLKRNHLYYENNKELNLEKAKEYYNKHIDRYREYQELNKERLKQYRIINKDSCYKRERNKYNSNIIYKIQRRLRNHSYRIIKKNIIKIDETNNLLGCDIDEFLYYIESQFLPEMTWENHGNIWELDHIMPVSIFDFNNEIEQKECFHFSNYQPLFKTTEIAKSFGYSNQIGNRNKKNRIIK